MSTGWIVFIVVLAISVAILVVLYFVGKKMQKKQQYRQLNGSHGEQMMQGHFPVRRAGNAVFHYKSFLIGRNKFGYRIGKRRSPLLQQPQHGGAGHDLGTGIEEKTVVKIHRPPLSAQQRFVMLLHMQLAKRHAQGQDMVQPLFGFGKIVHNRSFTCQTPARSGTGTSGRPTGWPRRFRCQGRCRDGPGDTHAFQTARHCPAGPWPIAMCSGLAQGHPGPYATKRPGAYPG